MPADTLVGMTSDSVVRQKHRDLTQLREKLSRESTKIGPAHERAAKARADAAKTKSDATRRSRLAEADRQDKKASDAEKERARIEGRIAAKEKELADARRKYDRAVEKERAQAMARMSASITRSEEQFHPSIGSPPRALSGAVLGDIEPEEHWDVFISHASEDKD